MRSRLTAVFVLGLLPLTTAACGMYVAPISGQPSPTSGTATTSAEAVSPWNVVGTWEVLDEPGDPTIRFGRDGDVAGFDGCNGFSQQSWHLESDLVAVSDDRLTSMMACGDGRGDWIDDVVAYRPDGAQLVAVDTEGDRVVTLTRVE